MRIQCLFIYFAALFAFSGLAQAEDGNYKNHMKNYIAIQEKLAGDDLVGASTSAKALKKAFSEDKKLKPQSNLNENLDKIINAKKIEDARSAFKEVSKSFAAWAESQTTEDYDVVYCPMAGAKWVQKKGEVANPYYGKEMLTCGEKIKKK